MNMNELFYESHNNMRFMEIKGTDVIIPTIHDINGHREGYFYSE